jgi:hypothetical protein
VRIDITHKQSHPAPNPQIDHMLEEIPNPTNQSLAVLPCLAPSALPLFGKLIDALAGQEFQSIEELLLATRVTDSI